MNFGDLSRHHESRDLKQLFGLDILVENGSIRVLGWA